MWVEAECEVVHGNPLGPWGWFSGLRVVSATPLAQWGQLGHPHFFFLFEKIYILNFKKIKN
jgi:hypothetical protein